ncbi:MAG TPA: hypothetical protein VMF05_02475 [Stellaceae bacterium]|nr:hypothetical protein [Stellaceae bacterium]
MLAKRNPLNLNSLQLKTLTLLQELARLPDYSRAGDEPGSVELLRLPQPHGDHFHVGEAVVASRDASGLRNPSVWAALERKGLIRSSGSAPATAIMTPAGLDYDTGLRAAILHSSGH